MTCTTCGRPDDGYSDQLMRPAAHAGCHCHDFLTRGDVRQALQMLANVGHAVTFGLLYRMAEEAHGVALQVAEDGVIYSPWVVGFEDRLRALRGEP